MNQVLENILKNAIEATGPGGSIKISTSHNPLRLVISDNGEGISDEIKGLLFTPFFTTKNSGQGIGLTLVKEILINHGFFFDLRSTARDNTEFIIGF